jgi:lysophospholipase L1-like esterase
MLFTLNAPSGATGGFQARSGAQYSVSGGTITVSLSDLRDALDAGFTQVTPGPTTVPVSIAQGGTGSSAGASNATPRNLLSQVQAIATPICVISAREAFSDSARETPAVDGGNVYTMRDISGNGFNASQSTTADQPSFRASGIANKYPALDFTSNPGKQGMPVNGLFAASGFSAGYTIYVVSSSPGPQTGPQQSGICLLWGLGNGDYFGLANNSGNGLAGNFNGGTSGINFNGSDVSGVASLDYSGVYVASYDGATATIGVNGRYKSSAIPGAVPTSGNLNIGNLSPGNNFYWNGAIGDVWVFQGKHTQAQMNSIGALLAADSGLLIPAFLIIGDSISVGYNTANPATMCWSAQMNSLLGANSANCLYQNEALSGETVSTMVNDLTNFPQYRTGYVSQVRGSQNIAFILAGTNDMAPATGAATPQQTFAYLQQLCASYRASGCKVAVGTCLPRGTGGGSLNPNFESYRQTYNNLIRTAGSELYDILMDFGNNNSIMGAPGADTNSTYYQADNIHPTELGQTCLGQIAAEAVATQYGPIPLLFQSTRYSPAGAYPGNFQMQLTPITAPGKTAGTIQYSMPEQASNRKTVLVYFNGYENDTGTNDAITFPTAFIFTPAVASNTSGLTVTPSTTGLTITSPDSTSTYSGWVVLIGF